ncbi:hypothetical protein APHAL10511_002605 [Amanita phalloides]|nr:hypothetical protein APHAL10511_002605 [Amanita phalloides]
MCFRPPLTYIPLYPPTPLLVSRLLAPSMDDLAQELPLNHRKRKADSDDCSSPDTQDSRAASDGLLVDTSAAASSRPSVIAPRLPWLATADSSMWSSPSTPSSCSPVSPQAEYDTYPSNRPKRPRLDMLDSPPSSPTKDIRRVIDSDPPKPTSDTVENCGSTAVNALAFPTGRALRRSSAAVKSTVIDFSSPYIPPLKPPVNRQTLQELELDSIIRNPQLRHDLLVEPRLQFRPTYSRRKRDAAEKYWAALLHELDNGCTCVSFDVEGKPCSRVCACTLAPQNRTAPITAFLPSYKVYTIRMPSRIRTFLDEFLEVLLLVIQPLSDLTDLSTDRGSITTQVHRHGSHATYIRSIFDPVLIEQEIRRGVFEPSGLLQAIGYTLKDHCAPMRDSAVDDMIHVAKSCKGDKMSPSNALKAFRMCMELLEVMKLDIANHQLQSLRPYLARTSGQYELKAFQNRESLGVGLKRTRAWLKRSRNALLAQEQTKLHSSRPSMIRAYSILSTNQQIHLATTMGLVELVFLPPFDRVNAATLSTRSDGSLAAVYPETLYLDINRLTALSSEAAELMALYLSLLLYRQLIQVKAHTGSETVPPSPPRLQKLTAELRAISGSRLGFCFSRGNSVKRNDMQDKRVDRCTLMRDDITLQIVKHVHKAHTATTAQEDSGDGCDVPDRQLLDLARKWVAANFHPNSPLSTLARDRLRNAVLDGVIGVSSRRDNCIQKLAELHVGSGAEGEIKDAGTEPLTDEIRMLVYKIARLASVHLTTYLPLYEQDRFLDLS